MIDYAKIFSEIFLSLNDREISHDQITGWLSLDQDSLNKIKQLANEGLADSSVECVIDEESIGGVALEDIEEKYFKSNIRCEITLHTSDLSNNFDYAICNNWSELLKSEYAIRKPIKSLFFIINQEYFNENTSNVRFKNYLNLHKIYELISFLSESTNSWPNTIFYQRPIKFIFLFNETDLDYKIDVTTLENLRKRDLHQEAIINLMCKEVVLFVKDIEEKQRASYLIRNFNALLSNILLSYQSYTENYSFDKVRKEYLEKRTEYIKKMNESFDSVATKMLAIPAAIWFAIAQIKVISSENPMMDFLKNYIVLITVFILVIILIMNIWGQRNILVAMMRDYESIFSNLSIKFENESMQITVIKDELDRSAFFVKIKMYFSILAALILFLVTLILLLQSNYDFDFIGFLNLK
ncbi:hypothetical protein [Acinetobacter sp. Leaf130]|uniref:hypothetical protein n=1 Tax=Acinetobacter sp. Leaf130 TaxID=1736269 RepID=UPI0006FE14B7|nr:hypothetical protein [Acinetobacter sp. Leaf130]KQQ75959.1 hypothetical protein ASF86_00230 [Acinetobacter sp. Leaf130]